MTIQTINLEVSYSQISVFVSALQKPFNDWTEAHVRQGFAWRPGSVSFRTLIESGQHRIDIRANCGRRPLSPDAVRVIEVPFDIGQDGRIEIASISDSVPITLPGGAYALRAEFLAPADHSHSGVILSFIRKTNPEFSVIIADPELNVPDRLITTASPA